MYIEFSRQLRIRSTKHKYLDYSQWARIRKKTKEYENIKRRSKITDKTALKLQKINSNAKKTTGQKNEIKYPIQKSKRSRKSKDLKRQNFIQNIKR